MLFKGAVRSGWWECSPTQPDRGESPTAAARNYIITTSVAAVRPYADIFLLSTQATRAFYEFAELMKTHGKNTKQAILWVFVFMVKSDF